MGEELINVILFEKCRDSWRTLLLALEACAGESFYIYYLFILLFIYLFIYYLSISFLIFIYFNSLR